MIQTQAGLVSCLLRYPEGETGGAVSTEKKREGEEEGEDIRGHEERERHRERGRAWPGQLVGRQGVRQNRSSP